MSDDSSNASREEAEAKITALVLGELTAAEEATVREALTADPDLQVLHDRIRRTLDLVREAVRTSTEPSVNPTPGARLDPARRERVLRQLRQSAPAAQPPASDPPRVIPVLFPTGDLDGRGWSGSWVALAACFAVLLGAVGWLLWAGAGNSRDGVDMSAPAMRLARAGKEVSAGGERRKLQERESNRVAEQPSVAPPLPGNITATAGRDLSKQRAFGVANDGAIEDAVRSLSRAAPTKAAGAERFGAQTGTTPVRTGVSKRTAPTDVGPASISTSADLPVEPPKPPQNQSLSEPANAVAPEGRAVFAAQPESARSDKAQAASATVADRLPALGDSPSLGSYIVKPSVDKDAAVAGAGFGGGGAGGRASGGVAAKVRLGFETAPPPVQGPGVSQNANADFFGTALSQPAVPTEGLAEAVPELELHDFDSDGNALVPNRRPAPVPRDEAVGVNGAIEGGAIAGGAAGILSRSATNIGQPQDTLNRPSAPAESVRGRFPSTALGQSIAFAQERNALATAPAPSLSASDSSGLIAESKLKQVEAVDEPAAETMKRRMGVARNIAAPAGTPAEAPTPRPEVATTEDAFSTFSLNVTDVSFKLAEASLANGQLPPAASIRSEEFLNAFDYRDPEPATGLPLSFAWERARDPFAQDRDVLRFGVRTAALGRESGRALNLVLVLDASGSMERADRVRIVHEALRTLATQLHAGDVVSVVAFARTPRLWMDGFPGDHAGELVDSIASLTPEGGTDLGAALQVGYETALKHFLPKGGNRVVLLTDGAANLGDIQPASLKKLVEAHRARGVALDCFGVGWEGYNDNLLETLSRSGDGRYGFLNSPEQADSGFARQLAGALHVAAADVKVQVEFNPRRVTVWREVGYLRHQLTRQEFRDNTVDAAEIGAAESGNALYLIQVAPGGEGPIGMFRVRYRVPETGRYEEHQWFLPYNGPAAPLDQASPAMRLAVVASTFAEWLSQSPFAAEVQSQPLLSLLKDVPDAFAPDPRPGQLETMIREAGAISGR